MSESTHRERQPTSRNALWWSGLLLTAALVCGWYFVSFFSEYGENLEKRALLVAASTAAASFDGIVVASLNGNAGDVDGPAFLQVRDRLQRVHAAIQGSRFAYLMALRNGEIIFLADAEPADSPDYSPPGEVYAEASTILRQVFATKAASIEGPLVDHWGNWVSGFAPVFHPKTGEVVAVFGVDVSAADWEASVARYRWLGVVISGLLAGTIVFLGLMLRHQLWLRAQLATASRIVENSATILYRLSGAPNLPLTFISSNIATLGYDADALLSSPEFPLGLVHPEDRATVEESQRRLLESAVRTE